LNFYDAYQGNVFLRELALSLLVVIKPLKSPYYLIK